MNRLVPIALAGFGCAPKVTPEVELPPPALASDLAARLAKLPDTPLDYDRALLDPIETQVLQKLIEASRQIDEVYLLQVSTENLGIAGVLERAAASDPAYATARHLFQIFHGRWDRLAEDEPFIAPFGESGRKPAGAGFYPADLTKAEFEAWVAAHPDQKDQLEGLFTVVRREGDRLVAVPYSDAYQTELEPAAQRLREAAALTQNPSLKKFLEARAAAFSSNDYFESDLAWMELDSPIEVVIGPYEVYEDGLFNFKAAFEAFVCVVDKGETEKLTRYEGLLPELERRLPIPDVHKNPNRSAESPIRVVQEVFTAGDARNGVQTAAFNLPNDEKVRELKGSKKVMLKNVMEAKFRKSGFPIGQRVLEPAQRGLVNFDAYFTYVLFHELAHSLGPGLITLPDGRKVDSRVMLKDLYSSLEECKADVVGGWSVLQAIDKGLITHFTAEELLATKAGLLFRSMRFGLDEAHGRGSAVQWNWYREKGAIVPAADGTFHMDPARMRSASEQLATEILMVEALGDYPRGQKLLDTYGVKTAEMEGIIARLADLPVDITPVFVAAGE